MGRRPRHHYRPECEPLEGRRALSAAATSIAQVVRPAAARVQPSPRTDGIGLSRITNPTPANNVFNPPFLHVLVQDKAPRRGQVYNITFVSVQNSTRRTFSASDNMTVRVTTQTPAHAYPVLSGNQTWKPGEWIVFYVATKRYYPLTPTRSAGFVFNFTDRYTVAIPGPSGIFQRVTYNPRQFGAFLDYAVTEGPGARGRKLGLPVTSIWQIVPAASADVL